MRPLTLLQFLFVLGVALLLSIQAIGVVRASRTTVEKFQAAARAANIDSAIELKRKDLAESVTFGLYDGASEQAARVRELRVEADAASRAQWRSLRWLGIAAGAAALLALAMGRLRPRSDVFIATLLAISLVLLTLGVSTPMLSFINERDLPVIGLVVTEAQTKSVWASAMALFESGNAGVGLILIAASIVVPIVKSTLLAIALGNRAMSGLGATPRSRTTPDQRMESAIASASARALETRLTRLSSLVGKFSFVDLFVASVFLAIFALRSFEGSTARAEPGLYYFAAYCVVSLIAGMLAWRAGPARWTPPA